MDLFSLPPPASVTFKFVKANVSAWAAFASNVMLIGGLFKLGSGKDGWLFSGLFGSVRPCSLLE